MPHSSLKRKVFWNISIKEPWNTGFPDRMIGYFFFSFSFLFHFFSEGCLYLTNFFIWASIMPHSSLKRNWIGVVEFSCFKKDILFVFLDGLSSLRFFSFPVLVTKGLLLRCKDFLDFSNSLSLSMLNRCFFSRKYRCMLCWKLETVTGSYSSLFFLRAFQKKFRQKVVKLGRR